MNCPKGDEKGSIIYKTLYKIQINKIQIQKKIYQWHFIVHYDFPLKSILY